MIALIFHLASSRLIDLDSLYETNEVLDYLYNETMEWGTYKPNLYFALKQRKKNPLTVGLIWASPDPRTQAMTVRHTYRFENTDNVTAYYEVHDGYSIAKEVVTDPIANVVFEISFLKQIYEVSNNVTNKWRVSIDIKPLDESKNIKAVPFIYLFKEGGFQLEDKFHLL